MAIMHRNRDGQFFLIGALLIITLLVGIVFTSTGVFTGPQTTTPRTVFDRALTGFPGAVNTGLAETETVDGVQQHLTGYLAFQDHTLTSHGLDSRIHAVVTVPPGQADNENLTVFVANFRGTGLQNVSVTVGAQTRRTQRIADGAVNKFVFTGMPAGTGTVSFAADRQVQQSFRVEQHRFTALYDVTVDGQDQTWRDTREY